MSVVNEAGGSDREFDPIAYIESAFVDSEKTPPRLDESLTELEIPSIQEFLGAQAQGEAAEASRETAVKAKRIRTTAYRPLKPETIEKMSAPRPRKRKAVAEAEPTIDATVRTAWEQLPRNVEFLTKFFDYSVTANYYTGEFKESREDLIRRILDPELNLEEVSRLLGVCPATVRRYTNRGWLAHHRTAGGQRRFRLSGLVAFVEEHHGDVKD